MSLYQIFYVSNASADFKTKEIMKILTKAYDFNSKNNITGVLLFRSGIFLQLLEGEKETVEALYNKIAKDPRHSNLIRLLTTEGNDRLFTDWSMGYHEVSDLDVKMINEILSWNKLISASPDIDNNLILHMLGRFKSALKK